MLARDFICHMKFMWQVILRIIIASASSSFSYRSFKCFLLTCHVRLRARCDVVSLTQWIRVNPRRTRWISADEFWMAADWVQVANWLYIKIVEKVFSAVVHFWVISMELKARKYVFEYDEYLVALVKPRKFRKLASESLKFEVSSTATQKQSFDETWLARTIFFSQGSLKFSVQVLLINIPARKI